MINVMHLKIFEQSEKDFSILTPPNFQVRMFISRDCHLNNRIHSPNLNF